LPFRPTRWDWPPRPGRRADAQDFPGERRPAHPRCVSIGERFVNEGLLGTLYYGKAESSVTHSGITGIVPEVEGSAWITSRAVLSVDPRDPLRSGYLVGGGTAIT
jgi:hypothetical protein